MSSNSVFRIRLISTLIIAFAVLLGGRLYFLQVMSSEAFEERADRQYLRSVQDVYSRGSIYFENIDGTLTPAAILKQGYTVAIDPKKIGNAEDAYQKISGVIPVDRDDFLARASKKDDPYEEIAKKISQDDRDKLEERAIPGVSTYKEKWRYYPQNDMAAHVIGFVGYKDDTLGGRYGLEKYYNDLLSRDGENLYANFFVEIFSNIKNVGADNKNTEGDIVATIEPSVQTYLEREVKTISEKYSSKVSGGIIINPANGEIAAFAVTPSFNPNTFNTEKGSQIFSNPLVENVYEMGSIMKPLTVAAGIDSKTITAESTYFDAGSVTLNNSTFYNFDKKGRGRSTMQDVLNNSLNTGVAHIVSKMGNKAFADYMFKFGLGEETGIDIPNEAAPLINNLKSPRDIEYATASFGQGVALTPIAMVRALSTLANGGRLITPHVVKSINYKSGLVKVVSYKDDKQVVSKETSEEISRMLVNVVDNALLEGTVKMNNYSIAAKTGTAQIAKEDSKGYYEDRFLHSFFGYFPAYEPRFLVFLFTVDPRGVSYASHTLTHPFIDITKFLINHYKIPPDR